MDGGVEHVRKELSNVRTGRASVGPARHRARRGVRLEDAAQPGGRPVDSRAEPDRRAALRPVNCWPSIEKAIRASDLGLNPSSDGKVVRIPIPTLTDERRKELSRHVHKLAEEGRNGLRQVRRDANERLKKLLKDHAISEDDERRGLEEVQKITDGHIKLVDDLQKKKDQELLGH